MDLPSGALRKYRSANPLCEQDRFSDDHLNLPFSGSRRHFDFKLSPQKNEHRKARAVFPGAFGAFLQRSEPNLLHHDLATRIERALYADALAFELGNVGLVVDVVGLSGIILQHVLVALLHNRSREGLAAIGVRRRCTGRTRALRTGFRSGRVRSRRSRRLCRRRLR